MLKFEAGHGGQVPGQPPCPRNIGGGQGGEAGPSGGQFCHVLNQVYGGGGGPGTSGSYHGYYGGDPGVMGGGGQGAGEQRPCVSDYLAAVNRHSHKQHYIQVSGMMCGSRHLSVLLSQYCRQFGPISDLMGAGDPGSVGVAAAALGRAAHYHHTDPDSQVTH